MIILLPLIFLAAFLALKPAAVTAGDKPADVQINGTDKASTSQTTSPNQGSTKKTTVKNGIGGDDDEGVKHKPAYGGHDDDDYDDD